MIKPLTRRTPLAAGQARDVIAVPRARLARLRAAVVRLLPDVGGLLPLFIGVTVTMALISAVLPLFDKP